MIKRTIVVLGIVSVSVSAAAQAPTPSTPPPPAPRAMNFADTLGAAFNIADSATANGAPDDFDFLVGLWEFKFQQRRPNGEFSPPFAGHWSAERKLTANAFIEDHFRGDSPRTTIAAGTWTYRVFNPQRKLWEMQGVGSENGAWAPGLCWSDAKNRYVIQHYGKTLMRIRYFNITDNTFQWRADQSADGGKTWTLDWWTMEAKRIAK
jgi:hypothetical protein